MLPFIALGKSRAFFWAHTEKQHGNAIHTAVLLEDNFQLSRRGTEELQKELQLHNKIWQLLQEEHRNSRSVCFHYAFHLKVSCWILNPTKLSAASRITNKNQGPTSNPSGVQRAGSRNVDCVCCYKNPSHATNYKCMEKRQDLLCKSKCKKFLGIPNSLQKVHAPVVFAHAVLAGRAEAHLREWAVHWKGRQLLVGVQLTISHNVDTTGTVSSQWCAVWLCYCCS